MSATELRETAADMRWLAQHVMAVSPHRTPEEICDVLEGAEIMDRRAATVDQPAPWTVTP